MTLITSNGKKPMMGLWASTSLVVGNMIGSGIFLLPAALAAYGGISMIGWIISSIGALILARVFSSLSVIIPKSGGPYTYSKEGLGDFAGFLVAWGYWISIICTNAAITVAMLGYLAVFFPILASSPVIAVAVGVSIIWFLTWVNSRGVKTAGFVQLWSTIFKVLPLLLIAVVGLFYCNLDHFTPLNLSGESSFTAIIQTTTLTLFAFLGIESATIPSENIENASTNIPKATYWGTLGAIAIYMLGSFAVIGMIPAAELVNSTSPFADAAGIIWGDWGRYAIAIGAIISTFGALNGWLLLQGQIPMAASKDGSFPAVFKKVNSVDSPIVGIIISSIFVTILFVTNYTKGLNKAFEFMLLLSTLTVLVPYLFSSAAYIILTQTSKIQKLKKGSIWIGMAGFLFSLYAVMGSGQEVVFWGFIMLMLGLPFYTYMKVRQSQKLSESSL